MRDLGLLNNVHLYCLPPHTTHKLQPLDVGVFGPLEHEWLDYCIEAVGEEGVLIDRHEFVRAYLTVRARSITSTVIKAAWKKTGIAPFNPTIFTDADFAPSHSTSTQAHLPASYPSAAAPSMHTRPSTGITQELGLHTTTKHSSQSSTDSPKNVDSGPGSSSSSRLAHGPSDDSSPTHARACSDTQRGACRREMVNIKTYL